MILALAAYRGWDVYQLNVKSAFLHGELNEAVFIEQPQGYEIKEQNTRFIDSRKLYMDSSKLLEFGTTN
jgi:hypothetical protein